MEYLLRKLLFTVILFFSATTLILLTPTNANLTNRFANGSPSPSETAYNVYDNYIKNLYHECALASKGLSYNTFKLAVTGYYNLKKEERLPAGKSHLAIVDFTKPSNEKRLFILDIAARKLAYYTYVAHGKNSGLVYAERFSNNHESLQSSLGFYTTDETYIGQHGYSLRLDGMDKGFNENARSRAIVMHGASYVGEDFVKRHGRTGLSWGCPAVSEAESKEIIDYLKSGNCIFIYGNNIDYLNSSKYLNFGSAVDFFAKNNL